MKLETHQVAKHYGDTRPDLPTLHLWEKERFIERKNKTKQNKILISQISCIKVLFCNSSHILYFLLCMINK